VAKPAALTFPGDGTFSWNTAGGSITFYYRIDTGTWTDGKTTVDMSPDSNVAKVTITKGSNDTTPPVITNLAVSRSTIWSPAGNKVLVMVTGNALDPESGISNFTVDVVDEYHLYEPHLSFSLGSATYSKATGTFALQVGLPATKNASDTNGRTYTLTMKATNGAGLTAVGVPTLTVTAKP
jgi:hypothetical protein